MPPTDASADAGSAPTADTRTETSPDTDENSAGTDNEDTLELHLTEELAALLMEDPDVGDDSPEGARGTARSASPAPLRDASAPSPGGDSLVLPGDDLLDHIVDWGPTVTPVGVFHLVPIRVERDLPLVSRWMNDPAVAAFWALAGPRSVTEDHVRAQLDGDGRSAPCVGVLDGMPMSYWEIYRADLDPLARYYPARPHDTGVHLLIGEAADRGRGVGSTLLRAVADLVLDQRPACARVVAEPDLHNIPSVAAFLSAGFRFSAEIDLPAKRIALMIRDRALRDLL
ncbi:GNAT family N-acetyltransferase [Streptomyces sp. S.PNR 29]|uniref:GNAT family N-acetyltransferase n=1 Tax=Streptomyces sp. S.PNR 29 TaxID=2973805 RepID=UPI0025B12D27|nr:GNAT family N-acetyltransferase [Streptomyces sp. S.PNR 29]MDN0197546.1 acetyltransferase [Streptomyces sp. S.PNR 29]